MSIKPCEEIWRVLFHHIIISNVFLHDKTGCNTENENEISKHLKNEK